MYHFNYSGIRLYIKVFNFFIFVLCFFLYLLLKLYFLQQIYFHNFLNYIQSENKGKKTHPPQKKINKQKKPEKTIIVIIL